MRIFFTVILTLSLVVAIQLGRGGFLLGFPHNVQAMEMDACASDSCDAPSIPLCIATHCLSAAVNDGVVLSVLVGAGFVLLTIVTVTFARIVSARPLAYAPARVFRDPRAILTTVKRE